jgi:hypothetical protein
MKFSKRVNYLLLSFLFVLNIGLRYPDVQHELGADSFVIHILSRSIVEFQYAKWILHPLSYIGLYPFSYPSAYPFLAAGVSTSTGLDVESSIFAISIILGLIGVFSLYFLAKEIKNDDLVTFWQASTRNLFIALAPACMLLLLKTRGFAINRMNFLFVFLLLTVGTSHRLGVFMIIILIAYLTGVVIFAFYKQLVPYMARSKKLRRTFRFVGSFIIIGIFLILLSMLLSGQNPLQGAQGLEVYEETALFSGTTPPVLILNLLVSLTGRIGLMLIFGLIGLAYLIWKKNKGLYEIFVIVSLFFLFPTIGMRTYYSYFFLIFFSLLAGLSFFYLFKFFNRKKVIALAILIATVIASLGFYNFMFDHWRVDEGTMPETTFDSAIYVKYQTTNTFIANDGLLAARIGAVSGRPCIPIGGSTNVGNGPEQLIYDYLHEDDYQIIPIPIQQITVGSDALYHAKGAGNVERDWAKTYAEHYDQVSENSIIKYRLQYSLADKSLGDGYWAYGRTYHSRFLASLDEGRYKIYDNGAIELYYFEYV